MGIRFNCQHCGRRMNVKDHLAGKRGICPSCGGKFDIPLTSTTGSSTTPADGSSSVPGTPIPGAEPAAFEAELIEEVTAAVVTPAVIAPIASTLPDPIAEAPQLQWYIAPVGSTTQFGPAYGALFRSWIAEGRVAPDSMVWREGWTDWKPAASVLPQLQAVSLPPHAGLAEPSPPPRPPVWAPVEDGAVHTSPPREVPSHRSPPAQPLAPADKRKVPLSIWIMFGIVIVLVPVLLYVLMQR
ncbi:MAG: DUF4339 domain-containing protein [Planctomycetaceae bacterium]|nr:DUF4339 domain-containing protein [Planctomycetaceae bacterium]